MENGDSVAKLQLVSLAPAFAAASSFPVWAAFARNPEPHPTLYLLQAGGTCLINALILQISSSINGFLLSGAIVLSFSSFFTMLFRAASTGFSESLSFVFLAMSSSPTLL
jgi:hypothetical protein